MLEYGLSGGNSLLEALRRMRPEFLRAQRATPSAPQGVTPVVYIEAVRAGGLEVLHSIPVGHVESVQFMRPSEALIRYGVFRNHRGGVILVTLRNR